MYDWDITFLVVFGHAWYIVRYSFLKFFLIISKIPIYKFDITIFIRFRDEGRALNVIEGRALNQSDTQTLDKI